MWNVYVIQVKIGIYVDVSIRYLCNESSCVFSTDLRDLENETLAVFDLYPNNTRTKVHKLFFPPLSSGCSTIQYQASHLMKEVKFFTLISVHR